MEGTWMNNLPKIKCAWMEHNWKTNGNQIKRKNMKGKMKGMDWAKVFELMAATEPESSERKRKNEEGGEGGRLWFGWVGIGNERISISNNWKDFNGKGKGLYL